MIDHLTVAQPIAKTRKAGVPQVLILVLINLWPMIAIIVIVLVVPVIALQLKDLPEITSLAPFVYAAPGLCGIDIPLCRVF